MIYILAIDALAASCVAQRMGLTRQQFRILQHEQDLRGLRAPTVFEVDDAYKRRDYGRIKDYLRAVDAVVWREYDYGRERHQRLGR